MMSQLLALHRIRCPQTLLKFLPTVRQLTASTAGETTLTADDPAEHLPHTDPHWGPLDAPDEPPEIIIIEAQHAQQEPPSQKPPMWFIQVPAQVNNFEAERLLPPQVPPHVTDHLRYPDPLEPGVEKKHPDPYDPAPRVVVAIERNLKIAKDKLPPNAEIVSQVVDVCKLLSEPSDYNDTEDTASKSSIGKSCL